jgi:hypothetical protein
VGWWRRRGQWSVASLHLQIKNVPADFHLPFVDSDPLPSAHLHNGLQEFISKLPAGLFKSDTALEHLVSLDERDVDEQERSAGVEVEWVLGVSAGVSLRLVAVFWH